MAYIFLDESGQFSKKDGHTYFVVGAFSVSQSRRTRKAFRSWQKTKYPRRFRHQSEIKWSDVRIDKELRLKTLAHIAKMDVRIHYAYLKKSNIPDEYKRKGVIQQSALYCEILAQTLSAFVSPAQGELRVFCDEKKLKGMTKGLFKRTLKARLLPLLAANAAVQVEMIDSTTDSNIQIVDWITGAIAWHLEDKPDGKECFDVLKANIISDINGTELFKDYWEKQNQKN